MLKEIFEKIAPRDLAFPNDPIGLQLGSWEIEVNKILVSLDVTEAVIDEAIEEGANMVFAHHAPLFNPIQKLDYSSPLSRIIKKAINNEISVFIAHTNLDIVDGGVNDALADKIGVVNTDILRVTRKDRLKKIAVFVPISHHETVMKALGDAGAGHIGNYSHCTFNSRGQGTFYPDESTNPFLGEQGQLTKVDEIKIETIFRAKDEDNIIQAMLESHPYEEVAYDIYNLDNEDKKYGIGRIGFLPKATSLNKFISNLKKSFGLQELKVIGINDIEDYNNYEISSIAVCGGSGGKFISDAIAQSADIYITGELSYHDAQYAADHNLIVIPIGHYHSEVPVVTAAAELIRQEIKNNLINIDVIESKVLTLPYKYL